MQILNNPHITQSKLWVQISMAKEKEKKKAFYSQCSEVLQTSIVWNSILTVNLIICSFHARNNKILEYLIYMAQ